MKNIELNIKKMHWRSFFSGMHLWIGVLIPFFMHWGKISFLEVMILQAWFVIAGLFLQIPIGVIADNIGRKFCLVLSSIFLIISAFTYAIIPNFWIFFIAETIWALANSFGLSAGDALIYDTLREANKEKKSKKILPSNNMYFLLGLMIAGPIGSVIAQYTGLRYVTCFMTLPFTAALMISFSLKEPNRRYVKKVYLISIIKGVKYFCADKILKRLAIEGIFISAISIIIIWTYQSTLEELNVRVVYFGFVSMLMCLSQAIVLNNFSFLEGLAGSRINYLFLTSLIVALSYIYLFFSYNVYFSVIAFILIDMFGISRLSLINNYMQKHLESDNRATILSVSATFKSLFQSFLLVLVGCLKKWSLRGTYLGFGIAILIFAFIPKVKEEWLID